MSGSAGVRLERDGPVATVTLYRSETPAAPFWLQLHEIGRELPGDVRVVVVRGQDGSFADLDPPAGPEMSAHPPGQMSAEAIEARLAACQDSLRWLRRPDLVSVAAVRGHATGSGLELALGCDLRLLAHDVQFAMTHVEQGLVPALGVTKRLVELVGYARAMEICLTGRGISADEAYRIGLASLVVPAPQLPDAVRDLVAALLAAPAAVTSEVKALLAAAGTNSPLDQEAAERAAAARRIRDLADLGE